MNSTYQSSFVKIVLPLHAGVGMPPEKSLVPDFPPSCCLQYWLNITKRLPLAAALGCSKSMHAQCVLSQLQMSLLAATFGHSSCILEQSPSLAELGEGDYECT